MKLVPFCPSIPSIGFALSLQSFLFRRQTSSNMGLMLKKPDSVAGSAAPAIIVGLFVAFGGILFGYVHIASGRSQT